MCITSCQKSYSSTADRVQKTTCGVADKIMTVAKRSHWAVFQYLSMSSFIWCFKSHSLTSLINHLQCIDRLLVHSCLTIAEDDNASVSLKVQPHNVTNSLWSSFLINDGMVSR